MRKYAVPSKARRHGRMSRSRTGWHLKQQQEAQEALREFPDVLTDIPSDTDLEMCDIDVVDDEKFRLKQYPTPFALQQEANEEVRKMLRLGIIEPSTSQYANPTVMIRKPDGSLRYCIDFRRLNSRTVFEAEPIPNPELVLSRLGKAKYISKMDLTKGFWQIPIREEDRHLTAFQTDLGLMQFRRMPFGLMNALARFCRMARKLLANIEEADSYVDDIFLHTEEWNNHIPALRKLLTTMREHRITARPSKCMIGFDKVEGLGHLVGKGELSPQEGKVDKILQVRRPDTKKELRSFLGVVGYYRKFIENFAAVAKPLTDMTNKGEPDVLRWNCKSEEAYEELKRRLSQHPILRLPQFDKEFILTTDASQEGIGAVLSQEYEGVKMPVMYVSRKLIPAETRYSTIERECLALVWAVKRLDPYLYGRELVLVTDHQPLLFLNRSRINNDRIMRWALSLQIYRYRVRVVKGSDNATADFLSRCGTWIATGIWYGSWNWLRLVVDTVVNTDSWLTCKDLSLWGVMILNFCVW